MSEVKPARKHFIRALPFRRGFKGQFGSPGRIPDLVKERGEVIEFISEDHALAAAGEVLCEMLNAAPPLRDKVAYYDRMTPSEFSNALSDLDITLTEFSWLWGTKETRSQKWIRGEDGIPHGVRVFLALLELPGALEKARETTSKVTEDRRPVHDRHRDIDD